MPTTRRRFLHGAGRAAGGLLLLPLVQSCGNSKSGSAKPSPAQAIDSIDLSGRRIEISFWHTQTGPKADSLNAIVDAFNGSQSQVTVKPEFQGDYNALFKKLLSGVAAGQTPDVAVSYPSMVSEYQSAGSVVKLDDYVMSARYGLTKDQRDDFIQSYWGEGKYPEYDGSMLSFPFTKSLLVLYYNADRLRSAGLSKSPEQWTWDDFAAAAKAAGGAGTRGWAIAVSASTFDAMVYSRGGRLISDDQKHWLFNQQPGVDSLAFYQTAVREGWGYRVTTANEDQADFAAGRAVFTLSSSSGLAFYRRDVANGAQFDWNVSQIPHANGVAPVTVLYGGSLVVFKSSPERQLASWLFLKYFSSPEVTAQWSVATGYAPVRKSALVSDRVQSEVQSNPPYGVVISKIAQFGRPETSVRGTEDTRGFIEDAITRVITDANADPKAALDEAARKGDQALRG